MKGATRADSVAMVAPSIANTETICRGVAPRLLSRATSPARSSTVSEDRVTT